MRAVTRARQPGGAKPAGRATALTLVAALLLSCSTGTRSTGETEPEPDPAARLSSTSPGTTSDGSGSSASQRDADAGTAGLPEEPTTDDPAALAGQLDLAAATLRDDAATAADLRRAGEFQQIAVRALTDASGTFRRKVTDRLHPETRLVTEACVRAARQLGGITAPQRKLPRWRIVAPAPVKRLLGHYREAQRRTGVPWTYLAAINLVETRMGRIRGTSTAGAQGPMQFIPATWEAYGAGGDVNDPRDAILAAARLLKANGAPRHMAGALWHYNPSASYVRAVSEYARTMRRSDSALLGYWQWRVLYRHVRGTYVLPVGYPKTRPVLLPEG